MFKEEKLPFLNYHVQKLEEENTSLLCAVCINLIPKLDKDITRKKNCSPISLMNTDAKITANWIGNEMEQDPVVLAPHVLHLPFVSGKTLAKV